MRGDAQNAPSQETRCRESTGTIFKSRTVRESAEQGRVGKGEEEEEEEEEEKEEGLQ